MSHESIRKDSKHCDLIRPGYCHVEGQAVRLADKVSYLISDLEDGLLLGAIDLDALSRTRLFNRAPIDLNASSNATPVERLILQRRAIIQIIMEDAILESSRRLARAGVTGVQDATDYVVALSPEVQADLDEIWSELQAGRLHRDPRVVHANSQAARRISELTLLFAVIPDMADESFRNAHQRLSSTPYMTHFASLLGTHIAIPERFLRFMPLDLIIGLKGTSRGSDHEVPTPDLVMAKDFVASLSDDAAIRLHRRLIGGA